MAASLDSYSDIEDSDDPLTESFNKAAEYVKKLVSKLEPPKLLELYSFYKQSTEGPCSIPRPRWYEMQAKAKWDAWNQLGNMSSEQAKKKYINIVSELDSEFDPSNKSESWITVSSLVNTDKELKESDKTIFDYLKDGEVSKFVSLIKTDPSLLDSKDEEGLSLIHWAADRGNVDILSYLIESKVNVNEQDSDGQSALHYAASCEHVACVEMLLQAGADVELEDSDGMKAKDMASDANIVDLLSK